MGMKLKKCKTCGRPFAPKGADDHFCSPICRTTGCFVAGGGDQTKPMSQEMKKVLERKGRLPTSQNDPKPKKVRGGPEKFPRVHQMFGLPMDKRWMLASTFSKEEAEYSRRLARKMLQDEWRMDDIIDWDGATDEGEALGSYAGIAGGSLGDSDDGTI